MSPKESPLSQIVISCRSLPPSLVPPPPNNATSTSSSSSLPRLLPLRPPKYHHLPEEGGFDGSPVLWEECLPPKI